jgi:clan AA aspartic protease (TIGR02281 family)
MKKIVLLYLINIFSPNTLFSQKIIDMVEVNGIYQIPCKVNGVPMNFIFDTGASEVTISLTEAKFLVKQNLLNKEDFIDTINYQMANGEIVEGTKIILKSIDIDGIILENVDATIINEQNSPLLLGQSAISKLGKYTISENKLIINNSDIQNSSKSDYLIEMEGIIEWVNEMLSTSSYRDSKVKLNYYLKLLEVSGGGYTFGGIKKETIKNSEKEEMFLIPINNISQVGVKEDTNNKNMYHLYFLGDTEHKTFITSDTTMGSFYSIQLNSSIFMNKLDKRFTKAFYDLIKYDALLTKSTQKY